MLLLLALAALTQDKLPPANPLPPPAAGTEEAAVLAPIERMFAALTARDGAALLAETSAEAPAIVSVERAGAPATVRRMTMGAFAANLKPGAERMVERITSPAIEIDGDMAMVWAPYTFTIDGKLSHCGTNHFGMMREGGRWRVASLAWTQRTTGCPAV